MDFDSSSAVVFAWRKKIAPVITTLWYTSMGDSKVEFSSLVKCVRSQLDCSQEELAREIGVSFATVNRWENGKTKPFRLARGQFDKFCKRKAKEGKLDLALAID